MLSITLSCLGNVGPTLGMEIGPYNVVGTVASDLLSGICSFSCLWSFGTIYCLGTFLSSFSGRKTKG